MSGTHARSNKRKVVAITAVLALAGTGAAFAYWTATGTGSGTATTGATTDFVVTTTAGVGDIVPGGAGSVVQYTVTNPSDDALTFSGLTAVTATADGVAWVPTGDCDPADYVVTIAQPTYGPIAGLGSATGTITVTLTDTASNQDDCQNQVVPLYLVAS